MNGLRTVVLETGAQAVLDEAIKEFPELEAIYQGLEWRISRSPRSGYPIKGTTPPAYLMRSKEWIAPAALVVLYTFTNDVVNVKAIRLRKRVISVGKKKKAS